MMINSTQFDQTPAEVSNEKENLSLMVALFLDIQYLVERAPITPKEIISDFIHDIGPRTDSFIYTAKTTDEVLNNYYLLRHLNKYMTLFLASLNQILVHDINVIQAEDFNKMQARVKDSILKHENFLKDQWLNTLVKRAQASHESSPDMNHKWFEILATLFSTDTFTDSILLKIDELSIRDPANRYFSAQILANIGTMAVVKLNYETFDTRVIALSAVALERAREYLPANVEQNQLQHLEKNIAVVRILPDLMKTLAWLLEKPQARAELKPAFFQETFSDKSKEQQTIIMSTVKFMIKEYYKFEKNIENLRDILEKFASLLDEFNPNLAVKLRDTSSKMKIQSVSRMHP